MAYMYIGASSRKAGLRRQCLCDKEEILYPVCTFMHVKGDLHYHAPQLYCHKGQELQELQCAIRVVLPPIGS